MSKVMPILNQLYAGKKITLSFESIEDRENFRTQIYKTKQAQDTFIEIVEDSAKRMTLRCRLQKVSDPDEKPEMVLWLEAKKDPTFKILSVEDLPTEEMNGKGSRDSTEYSQEKVSVSLGETGK